MVREFQVHELARRLATGEPTYLLDVRQAWEHRLAVLPATSHLVPLDQLPARLDEVAPPPGALVVVYCHHGVRSRAGARLLLEAGHAEVVSLAGGIDAWSREIDPGVPSY